MTRRDLLAAATALPLLATPGLLRAAEPDLSALKDMTAGVVPIGADERARRIARAQGLMKAKGIGAILIEPGASLVYFTGVRWWRSERLTAAVIPVEGEPLIVTPFFEEPSVHQTLGVPAEVRTWNEDEDPLHVLARWVAGKGLSGSPIGVEETARFFAFEGLRRWLPDAALTSANPVVRGCRMIKTPAEITLMQAATDVTIAAYRWVHPRVEVGMRAEDVSALMDAATTKLGGSPEFSMCLVDAAAALPHGSREPQVVKPGSVVLMDCGCTVEDYQSDVSRTFVVGEPSAAVRKVWGEVARGQQVAFAAAKLGAAAGTVDDAVRRFYEGLGYGPGYQLPGLSHRTGHGIGMDGHEPVNLVHGETTKLAAGMCFSDEPGLYLPGRFGVRLEDCFHMTESGPKWFSEPPVSLERPV